MKKFRLAHIALCLLVLLGISSCKTEIDEVVQPLSIQTNLGEGINQIDHVFPFGDKHFVVMHEDRPNRQTLFFKYSSSLEFTDSVCVAGIDFSEPVFDEKGNMIFACSSRETFECNIYKMNTNMEVIESRNIEALLPADPGTSLYTYTITRLKSGKYVVSYTMELPANVDDKVVLVAFDDPFIDNQPIWVNKPDEYGDDWLLETKATSDGGCLSMGTTRRNKLSTWMQKYDRDGKIEWREDVLEYDNYNGNLTVEDNRILFTLDEAFLYDLNGSKSSVISPLITYDYPISIPSQLVKSGNRYFCMTDAQQSDGTHYVAYSFDQNLKQIKSKMITYGGGTDNLSKQRFLIKLSTGDLVIVCHVANAGSTGYHWMMVRLNSELELYE